MNLTKRDFTGETIYSGILVKSYCFNFVTGNLNTN